MSAEGSGWARQAQRLLRPSWARAYFSSRRHARRRQLRLRAGNPAFSLETYSESLRSPEEAVTELLDATADSYRAAIASAWIPEPVKGDETDWASRAVLLEILSAIVTLTKPREVIEVGVERGYSSAVILAGLSRDAALRSIDLPRIREDEQEFIGQVIPAELRDRWHLTLGPSRQKLPDLLRETEAIDLFLHDGDHSYQSQLDDLRTVWPRVRQGGIVVVDDVWTSALPDFAAEVAESALLVERFGDVDAVGLMRKSHPPV